MYKIAYSTLSDGNMRFFGAEDETKIINNQIGLGAKIGVNNIARIRTIYDGRTDFTSYYEITDSNLDDFRVTVKEDSIPVSDGLYTKLSKVGLLLPIADCLGIVVYDPKTEIIGLLHSGRQNLEQYGATKFVERLVEQCGVNPAELKIFFSPCAQNYEIYALGNQKLPDAAKVQLEKAGVKPENIKESGIDTVTDSNFPSASAGDKTTRFAIIVAKEKNAA